VYQVTQKELSETVYEIIKEMILKNQLRSGEKLNQEKLAARLGVSRTPLLAAFSKLEKEMLVELVTRRGAFVKKLSKKEFEDLYDLRMRLEPLGAFEAANRRSDAQLAELRRRHDEFERQIAGTLSESIQEADYNFHMAIMRMSGNELLFRMISSFNIIIISNLKGLLKKPTRSLAEHELIYEAIAASRPEEAERCMYEHIADAKRNLLKLEF
jgi:DNA-binding GntR family transcriptional regulator